MVTEILDRLNPWQREAVLDDSDTCVVNANVGSGKTTVLIAKLLYLYYVKNIPYSRMIVLTFTHKAAEEIRTRLERREGNLAAEQLTGFGTFHSVAYRLLKQTLPVEELGYTREFTVLLPEQELELAGELIRREGFKIKYPARLSKRLETAARLGPGGRDSVEGKRLDKLRDDIWLLAEELKREKRRRNTMTFQELLENAEVLLGKYPINPEWIVIDEVQDSDQRQLAFLDALRGRGARLFAVGDPNQVIYGWKGSSINACFTLVHRYGAREMTLPMNYRSGSRILEAAGRFKQYGDKLTGSRDSLGQIKIRQAYDPLGEAYYLAEQIRGLGQSGVPLEQIAIFYRLQAQAQQLTDVFTREGIPHLVVARRERDSGEAYLEEEGVSLYSQEMGLSRGEGHWAKPGVRLMTLHASKGLEFTHVFIIGVNYGLIPLRSGGFDEEEEERRLFFVGMTRARDYLELSYYTQPGMPGVVSGESRYLQMIPQRLVERVENGMKTDLAEDTAENMPAGKESGAETEVSPDVSRRVRHVRYGVGTVIQESPECIAVDFGELGTKSFIKEFVDLEDVGEP